MYDLHRPDSEALIQAVQDLLAAKSVAVTPVWPQEDLLSHWQDDELLLSQACGYPLVTQLKEVQTVGCFHYSAPAPCTYARCRSGGDWRKPCRAGSAVDYRQKHATVTHCVAARCAAPAGERSGVSHPVCSAVDQRL